MSEYKPVAWARLDLQGRIDGFSDGWNPMNPQPLYSAATLAQMQAEIAEWKNRDTVSCRVAEELQDDADRLKAELSAAKELLREAHDVIFHDTDHEPATGSTLDKYASCQGCLLLDHIDALLQEKP
jgi:hypothetical protein